jgi:hypothetical protein
MAYSNVRFADETGRFYQNLKRVSEKSLPTSLAENRISVAYPRKRVQGAFWQSGERGDNAAQQALNQRICQ